LQQRQQQGQQQQGSERAKQQQPQQRRIHFYALDSQDPAVLWRVAPGFVVVYDADLAFLRQLEVYQVGQCYGM
jgi:hypothetical protein